MRYGIVVRFGRFRWGNAHAELDWLTEPTTQRVGELSAQVPFDFVLDETAGNRQQGKPFDDGEGLHEIQPSPLLRC